MQPEQLPKRVRHYLGHLGTAVEYLGKGHYRVKWDEPSPTRIDPRVVIPSRTVWWTYKTQPEKLERVAETLSNHPEMWTYGELISDVDLIAALRIAAAALKREGR